MPNHLFSKVGNGGWGKPSPALSFDCAQDKLFYEGREYYNSTEVLYYQEGKGGGFEKTTNNYNNKLNGGNRCT
jgi:hypothetical protein